MATKKRSPMTSFSSFEELASSGKVQNFNYERANLAGKYDNMTQEFDSFQYSKYNEEDEGIYPTA